MSSPAASVNDFRYHSSCVFAHCGAATISPSHVAESIGACRVPSVNVACLSAGIGSRNSASANSDVNGGSRLIRSTDESSDASRRASWMRCSVALCGRTSTSIWYRSLLHRLAMPNRPKSSSATPEGGGGSGLMYHVSVGRLALITAAGTESSSRARPRRLRSSISIVSSISIDAAQSGERLTEFPRSDPLLELRTVARQILAGSTRTLWACRRGTEHSPIQEGVGRRSPTPSRRCQGWRPSLNRVGRIHRPPPHPERRSLGVTSTNSRSSRRVGSTSSTKEASASSVRDLAPLPLRHRVAMFEQLVKQLRCLPLAGQLGRHRTEQRFVDFGDPAGGDDR